MLSKLFLLAFGDGLPHPIPVLLVESQALPLAYPAGTGRRTSSGWNPSRTAANHLAKTGRRHLPRGVHRDSHGAPPPSRKASGRRNGSR